MDVVLIISLFTIMIQYCHLYSIRKTSYELPNLCIRDMAVTVNHLYLAIFEDLNIAIV